jgi:hypothetical protein
VGDDDLDLLHVGHYRGTTTDVTGHVPFEEHFRTLAQSAVLSLDEPLVGQGS